MVNWVNDIKFFFDFIHVYFLKRILFVKNKIFMIVTQIKS